MDGNEDIKKVIPWERMSEIATRALDELCEAADYDYLYDFFRELDLSEEEKSYFAIDIDTDEEDW